MGGEVRIGKELNAFQTILKEWYYTCFTLGTMCFAALYLMLLEMVRVYWTHYCDPYERMDINFDESLSQGHDDDAKEDDHEDLSEVHSEPTFDAVDEGDQVSVEYVARAGSGEWEDLFYHAASDEAQMPPQTPQAAQYRQGPQRQ